MIFHQVVIIYQILSTIWHFIYMNCFQFFSDTQMEKIKSEAMQVISQFRCLGTRLCPSCRSLPRRYLINMALFTRFHLKSIIIKLCLRIWQLTQDHFQIRISTIPIIMEFLSYQSSLQHHCHQKKDLRYHSNQLNLQWLRQLFPFQHVLQSGISEYVVI